MVQYRQQLLLLWEHMNFLIIFFSALFSCSATIIMSYITMATPIGPWVETILVLGGMLLLGAVRSFIRVPAGTLGYATVAGGVAGIAATACGFSFPTLFFLDRSLFTIFMATPWYFCTFIGGLVLAGGLFGYASAALFGEQLLADAQMAFPVGQLTAKMLDAGQSMKKAFELGIGAAVTFFVHAFQVFTRFIPDKLVLTKGIVLRFDLVPMLFAIGFVTGHVLALPLLVGIATKYALIDPMHYAFFKELTYENMILAFCSGMVVQGALHGLSEIPGVVIGAYKRMTKKSSQSRSWIEQIQASLLLYEVIIALIVASVLFTWCGFSALEQLYVVVFAFICTYQLMVIGGKIGLAPLGRFATFVMLPGILLFGYDPLKAMVMATFVELSGGVAVDLMFGRKMAQVEELNQKRIAWYQLVGLSVCALVIGAIFWLLITHFGLGSPELLAQRAQSRALLIKAFNFDYRLLIIGALYSFIVQHFKISSLLVLGGLVMPIDFSLVLVAGGLATYLTRDKERWYPLWSGVFAASSLWMLLRALM